MPPTGDPLAGIDRSLTRIDAHMARGNELIERNTVAFEDLRTFLREFTLRHEQGFGAMLGRFDEQGEVLREQTKALERELRELGKQSRAQQREFVEENRAQRAALFRILDRLGDGGSSAGA